MTDTYTALATHYAESTGALRAALSYLGIRVDLALKTQSNEEGLRREFTEILDIIKKNRDEQIERDKRSEAAPSAPREVA